MVYENKARIKFEKRLNHLNDYLIQIGEMVSKAIKDSFDALVTNDYEKAHGVVDNDSEVNELRDRIEKQAIKILMKDQPVASDLRFVSASLKMVTDLERIGDQAADIGSIVIEMHEDGYSYEGEKFQHIKEMAEMAQDMVEKSISAFIGGDLSIVDEVHSLEDQVDDLFDKNRQDIISALKEDAVDPILALNLLMIAKYLERIGDHCENIIYWVYYSITGEYEDNK